MRKGIYVIILLVLIVGILPLVPLLLSSDVPNKIYFFSLLFFTLGFLFSLIVIMIFFLPFGALSKKKNSSLHSIEGLSKFLLRRQEELKTMKEELETELKARTHQLRKTSSELLSTQIELLQKEKLASLAQMASGVVHQIRNPLAIIKNATYLMRKKSEDEYLIDKIKIVEEEVDRMEKIARELLQFAKTNEPVALHPVDVADLMEEILEEEAIIQPNYEKVKTVNHIQNSLPSVLAERDSLREVFLNIISNAYQAMPDGGTLSLRAKREGKKAHIVISDTGIGMSSDEQKSIFEPFVSTKRKGGSGLGMAISYAIIKKLGGSIEVSSQEGKGTTFTVSLECEE